MKRVFLLLAIAGMMVACVGNDKKSDEGANGTELTSENKTLAESYYEAIQSGDNEAIKALEQEIMALSSEEKMAVEKRFNELKQEGLKAKPQTAKSLAQRMVEAENNEDYEAIDAILEEYYSLSYTEQKAADREYQRLCEEQQASYDYDDYAYDVVETDTYDDYNYETVEAESYFYDDYDYSTNRGVDLAQRAYEAYIMGDTEALNALDPEYEALTQSEQEAFEAEIYRLLSMENEVVDYFYEAVEEIAAEDSFDDYYYYYE